MNENQPKKVFKLQNSRRTTSKFSEEDAIFMMCCAVAMSFPQYRVEELMEEVPLKLVKGLYKEANRRRAENLLLLNAIINGPNSKSKTKKEYKDTIKHLTQELEE